MNLRKLIQLIVLAVCSAAYSEEGQVTMTKEMLHGSWQASGTIYSNGPGEKQTGGIGWFRKYTFFPDGTFAMDAYPPLQVKGKWSLLKSEGLDTVVITVMDAEQKEQEWGRYPISISGDSLSLGAGVFKRVP